MGKLYIGDINSKAIDINKVYIGDINNIARKAKKIYIGDINGKAKNIYSSAPPYTPPIYSADSYVKGTYNPSYSGSKSYSNGCREYGSVGVFYQSANYSYVTGATAYVEISRQQCAELVSNGYTKINITVEGGIAKYHTPQVGTFYMNIYKNGSTVASESHPNTNYSFNTLQRTISFGANDYFRFECYASPYDEREYMDLTYAEWITCNARCSFSK